MENWRYTTYGHVDRPGDGINVVEPEAWHAGRTLVVDDEAGIHTFIVLAVDAVGYERTLPNRP